MFFKEFFKVIKQEDLINQALHDVDAMYNDSKTLYDEAIASLAEKRFSHFDIYVLDKQINEYEKNIRKKILETLSINPKQEIVASLVMTSIIIDIERIGDYSKNIYELIQLCPDAKQIMLSNQLMLDAGQISELFDELAQILHEPNSDLAQNVMDKLEKIKQDLEGFICQSANSDSMTVKEAVSNVLFARYLKRVAAHLENISSSLSNSFDMIGFYQKNNH